MASPSAPQLLSSSASRLLSLLCLFLWIPASDSWSLSFLALTPSAPRPSAHAAPKPCRSALSASALGSSRLLCSLSSLRAERNGLLGGSEADWLPFQRMRLSTLGAEGLRGSGLSGSGLRGSGLRGSRLRKFQPLRCSDKGSSGSNEPEPSKAICRSLELAFRKVWLRLYTTGPDENYQLALKEFVSGAVQAFDVGYSLPALMLELARNEIETGDPNVDKTVRLTDQERQTREVWLQLVYLTLHRLKYSSNSGVDPPKPEDQMGLGNLVEITCDALQAGFTQEGLKLEMSLQQADGLALTQAQQSIRSQWTRIVFLTSDVIKTKPS